MKVEQIFHKSLIFNGMKSLRSENSNNFITQCIALQKTLSLLKQIEETRTPALDDSIEKEALSKNFWHFYNWQQVIDRYKTVEALYLAIKERQVEIFQQKEFYREVIERQKDFDPLYPILDSIVENRSEKGTYQLAPRQLEPTNGGISGSYFLFDSNHEPRFVVKPIDEDIGALGNGIGFATPFETSPIRNSIPLYGSSMREYLAYQIAVIIGASDIVPRTVLAILQSEQFSDLEERVSWRELTRYVKECDSSDKQKLCSVQEFVPNTRSLFEALQDMQQIQLSDEEIGDRFDQQDVEKANILIWTTFDTDAHGGNFLVYSKGTDSIGNEILGLKKIDNGLAFPEKNQQLKNSLASVPFANKPLSAEGLQKIKEIDIESITQQLESFGLEGSVNALRERIEFLKKIAENPGITLKEINLQMSRIGT